MGALTVEVHYRDERQVVVSDGPLLMRVISHGQSTPREAAFMAEMAREVHARHGAVSALVVITHGGKPPNRQDKLALASKAREIQAYGSIIMVVVGLRPVAQLMFRATASIARALGVNAALETELESAARRAVAELEDVEVEDVLRLYEDAARRILVQPKPGPER